MSLESIRGRWPILYLMRSYRYIYIRARGGEVVVYGSMRVCVYAWSTVVRGLFFRGGVCICTRWAEVYYFRGLVDSLSDCGVCERCKLCTECFGSFI